jgi:hypothetical protein
MSNNYNYDFLVSFVNVFDADVLSSIPDGQDPDLHAFIQTTLENMKVILRMKPGVSELSTFVEYNNSRYKLSLRLTE